jgi:hypothetical protein
MYDAMAGGFAQDLAQVSFLLRIVPRSLLNRVQGALIRSSGLSFSFSYVNKSYDGVEFCGARVLDVIHTPRVPMNPGIGIYFTQFQGCLSLSFAFLEGMLSEQDADVFMEKARAALLQKPV